MPAPHDRSSAPGRALPYAGVLRPGWLVMLVVAVSLAVAPLSSDRRDTRDFWIVWASATHGGTWPAGMYHIADRDARCNYPPVVTYLLAGAELVRHRLGLAAYSGAMLVLIKLPSILAHAGGALVCGRLMRSPFGAAAARRGAVGYLLCLPLFVNAAWWGQYDALLSLPMVAAVLLLANGRPGWAGASFGAAMAIKLQAIVVLPVLVVYALRSQATAAGQPRRVNPSALAVAAVAAGLAWAVLAAPDLATGGGRGIRDAYVGAVDHYPVLSLSAYNVWELVYEYRVHVRHENGFVAPNDHRPLLPHLSPKRLGLIAFAGYSGLACLALWRRPTRYNLMMSAVLVALAFFLLPTQIHERYVVPAVALAVPLAAVGARGERGMYAALVLTATVTQVVSILSMNISFDGHAPAAWFRHVMLLCSVVFSVTNIVVFAFGSWRLATSPVRDVAPKPA